VVGQAENPANLAGSLREMRRQRDELAAEAEHGSSLGEPIRPDMPLTADDDAAGVGA
jgi:hypothetical protein